MVINTQAQIHTLVICANIFIRKNERYLVLKRSPLKRYAPNVIHPVGGKVDLHEDPLIAAKREVLEEAGVLVSNIRLEAVLFELQPIKDAPENWMIFHFSGDYESGEVKETEEGELLLLSKEELLNADLFPSVKLVIENILNPHDGTVFVTIEWDDEKKSIIKSTGNTCVV